MPVPAIYRGEHCDVRRASYAPLMGMMAKDTSYSAAAAAAQRGGGDDGDCRDVGLLPGAPSIDARAPGRQDGGESRSDQTDCGAAIATTPA